MSVIEKDQRNHPAFIDLLGGVEVIHRPILSEFDLVFLSIEGITKRSVDALAGYLGLSKKSFAENILAYSIKTLERKKSTDHLDKRISSHVIEIAKVTDHAFDVFEDEDKVKRWLSTPNRALNQSKPIDLFDTLTGLSMVDTILGRIEEGIFS